VAQIKIYGIRQHLGPIRAELSEAVHSCVVDALEFPTNKRAHRFFEMAPDDLYFPESTTARYTIIEISMFEGRSIETDEETPDPPVVRADLRRRRFATPSRLTNTGTNVDRGAGSTARSRVGGVAPIRPDRLRVVEGCG
jgi:hypothetical protein